MALSRNSTRCPIGAGSREFGLSGLGGSVSTFIGGSASRRPAETRAVPGREQGFEPAASPANAGGFLQTSLSKVIRRSRSRRTPTRPRRITPDRVIASGGSLLCFRGPHRKDPAIPGRIPEGTTGRPESHGGARNHPVREALGSPVPFARVRPLIRASRVPSFR
jgi:hypothetical protein